MKPNPLCRARTSALLAVGSCIITSMGVEAAAQQYSSQQQGYRYRPPTYQAQPPSLSDRIRTAGRNAGDAFRRMFYGEPVGQAPAPRPPKGHAAYNLDAPPVGYANSQVSSTARPPAEYRYQTPPPETKTSSQPATTAANTAKAPARKPDAGNKNTSKAAGTSSTSSSSKDKYVPAKPSTLAKSEPRTKPPAPRSPTNHSSTKSTSTKSVASKKPASNAPVTIASSPPIGSYEEPELPKPGTVEQSANPTTEAKLNDVYPLPGGIDNQPVLSPTINSDPIKLGPPPDMTDATASTPPSSSPSQPSSSSTAKESSPGKSTTEGTKSGSFLVGKRTSKPGRVVSPYPPYNELDITGLPSGSLALDPTTQKVFQVP